MSSNKNMHPFFKSSLENENFIDKQKNDLSINSLYENIDVIDKEKLLKGEIFDKITELEAYSGNVSSYQLKNIDYSKFSNHVFFDSAVHKISYAFSDIFNFPFDKPENEYLRYLTNLDGYTRYVLDNIYPKHLGHMKFNGDSKIIIKDRKGYILKDYDNIVDSKINGSLSPNKNEYTFSFHIRTPTEASINLENKQCVFKKTRCVLNTIDEGYICFLSKSSNKCNMNFALKFANNTSTFNFITLDLDTEYYINIVVSLDNQNKINIDFYKDGELEKILNSSDSITSEEYSVSFKDKDIEFIIGSGEDEILSLNEENITLGNFSGSIDEFIFFNKKRDKSEIKYYENESIYTDASVLLYLKFNEPPGNYSNSYLIFDASGNKLHGFLTDLLNRPIDNTSENKITGSFLSNEDIKKSPVQIGSYPDLIDARNNLLNSANEFDSKNSNIIFNLIPKHYFSNNSNFEEKNDYIDAQNIDNLNNTPDTSMLTNICLIWARFFDQLKLYVDALSGMFDLDYESINNQEYVNIQMSLLCEKYGFSFSEINPSLSRNQNENKNLLYQDEYSDVSISKLQNLIWKKILINSNDFLKSKGTLNSIKSVFNACGFEFEKYVNFEEKSNKNYIHVEDSFTIKKDKIKALDFSKFKNIEDEYSDSGHIQNKPFVSIEDVSMLMQVENEKIKRSGVSNDFSHEIFFGLKKPIYKKSVIEQQNYFNTMQSILRVDTLDNICIGNLYAKFNSNTSDKFDLYYEINLTPTFAGQSKRKITLKIQNINAYDIDHYVGITYKIEDISSSNNKKVIVNLHHNSLSDLNDNNYLNTDTVSIIIGPEIEDFLFLRNQFSLNIGKFNYNFATQSLILSGSDIPIQNSDTDFQGHIYNVKLWKKCLDIKECLRHSQDIFSIGEEKLSFNNNLLSNFGFNNISMTNAIVDFENNSMNYSLNFVDHLIDENSNFLETNSLKIDILNNQQYNHDDLFSYFDLVRKTKSGVIESTDNNHLSRVRILSFSEDINKKSYNNFNEYPTHEIQNNYKSYYTDMIEISMSSAKIINESFERLINNIDVFLDVLSKNACQYHDEYYDLSYIRESYFENFKENEFIDLNRFYSIFKYFDNILNNIIFSLIPHNVNFNGFNFIYESCVLERSKYAYKNKESNIQINDIYDYRVIQEKNSYKGKRNIQYNNIRRYN